MGNVYKLRRLVQNCVAPHTEIAVTGHLTEYRLTECRLAEK